MFVYLQRMIVINVYQMQQRMKSYALLKRCLERKSHPYIGNMTAVNAILFQGCQLLDKMLPSLMEANHSFGL